MSHIQNFWKIMDLQQNRMAIHYDVWKKVSILHKRKPCKVNIGPYNTVLIIFIQ